jgi:hypothetical protein
LTNSIYYGKKPKNHHSFIYINNHRNHSSSGLFAPIAFEEQCKQNASKILNNLYSLEGNKENFLASYEKGTISNRSQVELQKLDMVLSNCPELKSTSTKESDYDISFLRG